MSRSSMGRLARRRGDARAVEEVLRVHEAVARLRAAYVEACASAADLPKPVGATDRDEIVYMQEVRAIALDLLHLTEQLGETVSRYAAKGTS